MVDVRLEGVAKSFGETVAVDHVDLRVNRGEFFTLLGPSGCGKTTTLRILAGFILPDEGKVYFDDKDITYLPPYKRNTGMVFQNYALWPHMTVFDNVAYGLKLRKLQKDEINKRVERVLELVGLKGFEKRSPAQLSGGQQQRVALARALVIEPDVLLLDEPLSNLDAKLRLQTRTEITKLQRRLGITTVYVTHDQEEALCISDRIAVMNKGSIQQIGSSREIYEKPSSYFVADFIGMVNAFLGKIVSLDKEENTATASLKTEELMRLRPSEEIDLGKELILLVRPEAVSVHSLEEEIHGLNTFTGVVKVVSYLGDVVRYEIALDAVEGGTLRADVHNPSGKRIFSEGEKVRIEVPAENIGIVRRN